MNLEPEVFQVGLETPLVSLIYSHLRMGLPVILGVRIKGVGLHGMTVVGYSLADKRQRNQEEAEGCAPMVGQCIDKFYVHDDQIGPFAPLKIKEGGKLDDVEYPVTFEGEWADAEGDKTLFMYPRVVIIPVYHKIRVTFLDVHSNWIIRLNELMSTVQKGKMIEWDVFLTTTNDYKKAVQKESLLSKATLLDLLLRQQPKYFWCGALRLDGKKVLELLVDATDMARSFPVTQAVWYDEDLKSRLHRLMQSEPYREGLLTLLTPTFLNFLLDSTK